jgi:hypothetical protein
MIKKVFVSASAEATLMAVAVAWLPRYQNRTAQDSQKKITRKYCCRGSTFYSNYDTVLCRDNMSFCYPISHTEVNVQYSAVCRFDTSHSRGADNYLTLGGPQSGVFITKNMCKIMKNCSTIKVILVF